MEGWYLKDVSEKLYNAFVADTLAWSQGSERKSRKENEKRTVKK